VKSASSAEAVLQLDPNFRKEAYATIRTEYQIYLDCVTFN